MSLHVRVVTHTIPNAFGIALTAMVVLTVKQSVFVANSLLQRQPSITVCTCNILNSFFFHPGFSISTHPSGCLGLCIGNPYTVSM